MGARLRWAPSRGATFKSSALSGARFPALSCDPSNRAVKGALDSRCQGEGQLHTDRQCDTGTSVTVAAQKWLSSWLWGTWLTPEPPARALRGSEIGPLHPDARILQHVELGPSLGAWPSCSLSCAAAQAPAPSPPLSLLLPARPVMRLRASLNSYSIIISTLLLSRPKSTQLLCRSTREIFVKVNWVTPLKHEEGILTTSNHSTDESSEDKSLCRGCSKHPQGFTYSLYC